MIRFWALCVKGSIAMSIDLLNGSVAVLKKSDRFEFARLVNSWFATAEETVAAGKGLQRILARRRVHPD